MVKNKKTKLIFFDMDGVITETGVIEKGKHTAASTWTVIAKHLGKEAFKEEEETKAKWNEGFYNNYLEWMEDTIRIHQKYNLDMEYFYKIMHSVPYMEGAIETLKELIKRGYRLAIMSGSFKNLANEIQRESGIHHVFAACEYFFDEDTHKLVSWNLLPTDYIGKIDFMRLLMREYRLKEEECAFIGDGVNDIPLAKQVGLSIAFNGREELQKACTHAINQKRKDLRAILKFFP
ncbi:HAD-IB family phosphatase [Candidatus Woesearchaeota archaeon]|nr:HAD-IB family phosphatase [Candidatus Woesearchaeota archaeon]